MCLIHWWSSRRFKVLMSSWTNVYSSCQSSKWNHFHRPSGFAEPWWQFPWSVWEFKSWIKTIIRSKFLLTLIWTIIHKYMDGDEGGGGEAGSRIHVVTRGICDRCVGRCSFLCWHGWYIKFLVWLMLLNFISLLRCHLEGAFYCRWLNTFICIS